MLIMRTMIAVILGAVQFISQVYEATSQSIENLTDWSHFFSDTYRKSCIVCIEVSCYFT